MEKAKKLALELLVATQTEDIEKAISLSEEIHKVMMTYKRSC